MREFSSSNGVRALGKYTLLEKLGEGYLGPVYKGFDQDLGRAVAIRILCDGIKWDTNVEELFHSECRAVAGLQHPNIATIFEVGKEGTTHYIVMESLESGNLQGLIAEKPSMPAEAKLSVMVQVVEGLSHAHRNGILHRDLGPGKIHVSADGSVKIRDFAITQILMKHLPHPIVRWGAPIYLSPEQIQQKGCDERSDIFSAGLVFYELFTYFHPFHDANGNKALDNIVLDTPIPTFERFPDVPPGLWSLLKTCMARDPGERYQSMDELLSACRDLQKSLAEDTQLMLAELYASLAILKKAVEQPNASESIVDLFRDIQEMSRGDKKADYIALDRLITALIEQYPVIQAEADAPDSVGPQFLPEIIETAIPAGVDSTPLAAPVESGDVPLQEKPAPTTLASSHPNPAFETADGPQVPSSERVEPEKAECPETNLPVLEDLISEAQHSAMRFDVGSEANKPPAATSRYRRIPRPSYRAVAALLSILVIAAAAYIVLGTEACTHFRSTWDVILENFRMTVKAAVPHPEPTNAGDPPTAAEMQGISSTTNPLKEGTLSTLKEFEEEQRGSNSEMATSQPPRGLLGRVETLINTGKLQAAKVELNKLQKAYPRSPDVLALHKQLRTKSSLEAQDRAREEEHKNAVRKQREDAWNRRLIELFARGNYSEAGNELNRWLAEDPGNSRAQDFGAKLEKIERDFRIINSALSESRYQDALDALRSVEKNNPADPNVAELRREIEIKKASARAMLTVHRLGSKALLLLDGRPIGTDGEIQNESIPIGKHTVSIESNNGLIASRSQEYLDGQQVVLIYDLSRLMLRPMSEADLELLAQRKMMEEVHRFELEHEHGLFRGSCRGVLSVDYYDVAYKPFSGQHGFRIPFKLLKVSKVEGKSIELSFISDDKHFESFKFQNERDAQRFMQIWKDLKAIPQ
jgi:serine/threonine protein kinase/tetratricopeptide (TPR) repeat protein